MNIKVYSKNNCIQCEMTKMWLNQNKIQYESVDVSEHPEKLEKIKLNGFQQLPVVALDDYFENAWSGYNLDRLEELKESC